MTPEEIATLLDLPEPVRAALAVVDGPGWFVSRNNDGTDSKSTPLGDCPGDDLGAVIAGWGRTWAWCPADTYEVVRLCGDDPRLMAAGPAQEQASAIVPRHTGRARVCVVAPSPRLAALRLLASVSS